MLLFVCVWFAGSSSGAENDTQILLKFKNSLSNRDTVLADWNDDSGTSPCTGNLSNWTGLKCKNGTVFGLKLENMGLSGSIDIDALAELTLLRTLSLMNNSFGGPFPDVNKLVYLRALYFSYNPFSGEIREDGFAGMTALQKVYLARNNFSGKIPKSLAALPSLSQLSLEGNRFQGKIPNFEQGNLTMVNVANNQLKGRIPYGLSKMDSSFFAGTVSININFVLCSSRHKSHFHPLYLHFFVIFNLTK